MMKYIILFIFLSCFFRVQAQDSGSPVWWGQVEPVKTKDGAKYWILGNDTLAFKKPVSREEMRSSRDIFFYQRGDTAYFLYDPSDSLQFVMTEKSWDRKRDTFVVHDTSGVGWYSRPKTQDELELDRMRILDVVEDPDLWLGLYIDTKFKPKFVTREFVERNRAITREEFVAFFHREKRRCEEAEKRTGNMYYSIFFSSGLYKYFAKKFLLIPLEDGRFELYKLR